MEVSNDGPAPADNPSQQFLDLSNADQQIASFGAAITGAFVQGFQDRIIPAIQNQGANLANHMAEGVVQRGA